VPEVLGYRDRTVEKHGLRLHVASVQDYIDRGITAEVAHAPQSIGVRLADQRDVSRGDMITTGIDVPALTRDVRASVCHLADRPLKVGDRVQVRHTTRTVKAIVKDLAGAAELTADDLGRITLRTAEPRPWTTTRSPAAPARSS
jgi:sulfate adenylyltransferase subunit 1 (EFTu-like GTPase family)